MIEMCRSGRRSRIARSFPLFWADLEDVVAGVFSASRCSGLSKVINSMPAAPSSNLCSVVPITHVIAASGKAVCRVRTTGRVLQQSPIADRRSMHIESGAAGESRGIALGRQVVNSGGSSIVYDDTRVSQIGPDWFRPESWPDAGHTTGKSGGRGTTYFIRHDDQDWVLRHYYRGGLPGALLEDQFLWAGSTRTRSFREWDLLYSMRELGLPVPVPVAARYVHRNFVYTADLITVRLPDVESFSSRLTAGPAGNALWRRVGECIARFHFHGFCHADLNAHNIQVNHSARCSCSTGIAATGGRRQAGAMRTWPDCIAALSK